MRDAMYEFITSRSLCVISTVGTDAKPESAIVGFSHTKDLELVIGTSNKSRKYANLVENPHVAIVIGDETAEIQYEGTVEIVPDGDYKNMIEQAHIRQLPGSAEYRKDPNQVYVKVTPTWIRFLKHGEDSGMEEFTEFSAGKSTQ